MISDLKVDHHAKRHGIATTGELTAIRMPLHHLLLRFSSRQVVIFTYSRCALKQLLNDYVNSAFVREVDNAYVTF